MQSFGYVLKNFFTHKDFLVPGEQIPGTLLTPLHICFESFLVLIIILGVLYSVKHRNTIRKTFIG